MIDIDNQTNLNIPIQRITDITASLTDKEIELLVVEEDEMRSINEQHRGIAKSTDVLSFPLEALPMAPLGSIIICCDIVKQVSSDLEHSQDDEFTLLYIHGLLHLLGFDHEVDNGEMREKEEALIKAFNLPKSLIVRTQEKEV
jgi:probable rRNA maturation factor